MRKTLAKREESLKSNATAKSALAKVKSLEERTEKLEISGGGRCFRRGKRKAFTDYCKEPSAIAGQWRTLTTGDLAAVNATLARLHVDPVQALAEAPADP